MIFFFKCVLKAFKWDLFLNCFSVLYDMAVGQNPGTPVNIPKAFKIDYLGRVIIPKKVP